MTMHFSNFAVRRELLDQALFWNQSDLEAKLTKFMSYYNETRCHYSLADNTPNEKGFVGLPESGNFNGYRWKQYCNGLFELPIAA